MRKRKEIRRVKVGEEKGDEGVRVGEEKGDELGRVSWGLRKRKESKRVKVGKEGRNGDSDSRRRRSDRRES